jgi:hypothetical protein
MRINPIQRLLLRLTLFFCWFISFAAFNFESANWGLQVGWICAFLFCLSYSLTVLLSKDHFLGERTFIAARRVLLVIFGSTTFSLGLIFVGAITLPNQEMLTRTLGHTGYVGFYAWVFICVFHALRRDGDQYWSHFHWFFIYPFVFIAMWGIYQNLTTYGIAGEYINIFNNSVSTGFTYERFREAHRVSSVFPEPSEYSYYLAMMGPIVWAYFRRRLPCTRSRGFGILLVTLWIIQAAMVKSLSFFLALPVVLYVCFRYVEGRKFGIKMLLSFFIATIALVPLVVLGLADRIGEMATGGDASVLERYVGLLEALDIYLRSPVVGFGYGAIRGLDALSFALASFGTVGTLALLITIQHYLHMVRRNATPILSGAVLCLIAGCILSNNVLSHLFIWVLIAVTSACIRLDPVVGRARRNHLPMLSLLRPVTAE